MHLATIIAQWGLPALFLGGLLEGDTVAMLGGALAHRAHLTFAGAAAAVSLGAAFADQFWFHLARARRDRPLIRAITARPAFARALGLVRRRPALAIVLFRFIPGTRTIGPVALGAAGIPPRRFVPLNLAAVAAWGLAMTGAGYGGGHLVERSLGHLPLPAHLGVIALAAIVLVALILLLLRRTR